MSLLDDILTWATTELTTWQRDALRRLFQKQDLDAQDYDDLYAMLRSSQGLPDPQNRRPAPLAQQHLPVHTVSTTPVILRAMRDLKHVNRIVSGQKLEFAPKGLTVIYGGTGSGKSGYSRVLKRACRARDISETVHPDAFDPNSATKIPEAMFDVDIASNSKSLFWKRTMPPPDELSSLAVFDARCARAYLDTEQEAAYLPYGLDIVENLAQRVLPELAHRLNAEIAAIDTDVNPFADLQGETVVGRIVASLSATSDSQKLNDLAKLTGEETNRLNHLEQTLAEPDPKSKAIALRLSSQRVEALISRIGTAVVFVDSAAIGKLKAIDNSFVAASRAETTAATAFRAGEQLLAGTGEPVWRSLFDAARRFSTEVAYPNKPFPNVDVNSQCPLCQQTFDKKAAERMQRFDNFIKQETAKVAAEMRKQREEAIQKLERASLGFGLDTATTAELEQLDPARLRATQDFEDQIEARRMWMLTAVKEHSWDGSPALDRDPRVGLKSLSTKLVGQAADLDKAGDETEKKRLESECAELRSRANLAPRVKAVLDLIGRMQLKAKLVQCKDDLKTKVISDKARELANKAVTAALKSALDAEFKALGVGHIKTKLNSRVEQGKMRHKLVLDLPVTKKLDEILSEGEQRAIALGSFLAEMHLANHLGGIVFDDPVSSLDHYRRKDVARRLVEEAKIRQVIILTHDTVFLGELRDVIEQQTVDHLILHLDWVNGHPGQVNEGLPWEHKSYMDRFDKHEKSQKLLEKNWPAYPNDEDCGKMRHEYSLLRSTIERVIQDVVFNGVVQRYRDWIRVDKLDGVFGVTDADFKSIARLHKACCDVVDSHDPASAKNSPVPNATQLGQDIADLKAVVDCIKRRRKGGESK
jgi:ABC-type lipoprotein export system ATPase subunit